jgi:hypothetical protein
LEPLLVHEPRPFLHLQEGFGVFWSAKSGSKAVSFWYFARMGLLREALDYSKRGQRPNPIRYYRLVLSENLPHKEWLSTRDPANLAWLRVIRDPYNRAVSSFRHLLRFGYESHRLERLLGLSLAGDGLSFAEFLTYLSMIDIASCNRHHSQQWHPLEEHVTLRKVVNIDKTDLLTELHAFEANIGQCPVESELESQMLQAWTEDSRRYHKRINAEPGVHATTRFKEADAVGAWPNYDAFLNDQTRRQIEEVYAKDFAAYAPFI